MDGGPLVENVGLPSSIDLSAKVKDIWDTVDSSCSICHYLS